MNVVVTGDCLKHDFILAAAVMLKLHTEKQVAIITDNSRNYDYFEGEVSGVMIGTVGQPIQADIILYDWHRDIPEEASDATIIFATTYERKSIEHVEMLLSKQLIPSALLVIEEDSVLDVRFIEKSFPMIMSIISYIASSKRKIDWVHDGHITMKVDSDFADAINEFLIGFCNVPKEDIKKLWKFARKWGK
ncbi:hypothetical protein [Paenibacillus sp. FSL H8-0537]|uniref:hypothetical protein n=1 Tax=Paenibacillus sp. FSL H8-0537 TaxID=2921399 RepID=UPI003100C404